MTILEYANWVPLPTPVTTGTTVQSFTAPDGEVWVAANGVNSGAWKKARDVFHCLYSRAAAFNTTSTAAVLACDTRNRDDYTLYNSSTGVFTAPVAGWWQMVFSSGASATAVGQLVNVLIQDSGGITVAQFNASAGGAGIVTGVAYLNRFLNVNDTFKTVVASSVTLTGRTSYDTTRLTIDYLGTG